MDRDNIMRQFAELNKEYGSTGRNLYSCANGHHTITRHRDKGVTPMFITCPCCGARATSHGYRIPQQGPLIQRDGKRLIPGCHRLWVRPTADELLTMTYNLDLAFTVQHIISGGLIFKRDLQEYVKLTED